MAHELLMNTYGRGIALEAVQRALLEEERGVAKEGMKHRILIVDDDQISLTQTRLLLEDQGYLVDAVGSGFDAVKTVKNRPDAFALILLDHQMRGKNGPETANEILAINPDLYILMYSNDQSRDAMKQAWRAGVLDFIEKSVDVSELLATIKGWCRKYEETSHGVTTDRPLSRDEQLLASIGMAGRSQALLELVDKIAKYRRSVDDVLILGETGCGKELVASSLHTGDRNSFVEFNCARYSDGTQLLESELFGHEKGAFTGADTMKAGLLERADIATLFFDEIHHLNKQAQAKLLRALGERKGMRLGGRKEYPIKCRLILAAKPDLEKRMERGEIAEDFFYRIHHFVIQVPPLRERPEDVEPLVAHFVKLYYEQHPQEERKRILMRTVRYFEQFSWPGNVRELKHTVDALLSDVKDKDITPKHLPPRFFVTQPKPTKESSDTGPVSYEDLKKHLEEEERRHIRAVLKKSVTRLHAAKKLGIAPSTLHHVMKRLGIEFKEERP